MKALWTALLCLVSASAWAGAALEVPVGAIKKVAFPMGVATAKSLQPSVVKVRKLGANQLLVVGVNPGTATVQVKTPGGNVAEIELAVTAEAASTYTAGRTAP